MREIVMTGGLAAIVDDADYDDLIQYTWHAARRSNTTYAVRNAPRKERTAILMHRHIMAAESGQIVDHRNRNGLDNRRSNLRLATAAENLQNLQSRRGTSQYKGVSWHAKFCRWRVAIKVRGRQLSLGLYEDEEHAARVYDAAARLHFGEFARPNFPDIVHVETRARSAKRSSYIGVTRDGPTAKWCAYVHVKGTHVVLGRFSDEIEAARVRDAAVVARGGGHRQRLNFPGGVDTDLVRFIRATMRTRLGLEAA